MSTEDKYTVDVLLSEKAVQNRVSEVVVHISKDFKDKEVLLVSVLNGSFIFCADLVRESDIKRKIDFISISSYRVFRANANATTASLNAATNCYSSTGAMNQGRNGANTAQDSPVFAPNGITPEQAGEVMGILVRP